MATLYSTALSALAAVVDNGVLPNDPRITARVDEAQRRLIDHHNFISRREEVQDTLLVWAAGGTNPGNSNSQLILDNIDATKLVILAIFREENNQLEMADSLEKRAYAYVERNLVGAIERQRRDVGGIEGRLHNELPEGTRISTPRMTAYVSQAETEIMTHRAFIQRRENYAGLVTKITYEEKKLMVESYVATSRGQTELSIGLRKQGLDLVERNVVIAIEGARTTARKTLAAGSPDTFGYHWARLGLDMADGASLSDETLKRVVNTAEEQLMQSGKWVGTVDTYVLDITASGEVFLPRAIETVMFVSYDSNPQPVYDRFNEWLGSGSGFRTEANPWRYAFVDRGESVDPTDGLLKRKYFVSFPDGQSVPPVVTVLAKNRFLPHYSDTESMFLRNYQAVSLAAKALLTDGKLGSFDEAKKFLAQQIDQQIFRKKPATPHNSRVVNFR